MGFNLANQDQMFSDDAEVWARVDHPDQIDVFFEVLTRSKRHPENKTKLKGLSRKLSKDRQIAERRKQEIDPLKYEGDLLALTAGLVIDWRGISEGKNDVEFNREKLVELMKTQPWIFSQIDKFQADDNNFFGTGA